MKSKIILTDIIHERFLPFHNKFKYFIPALLIDNRDLSTLNNKFFLFSINSFNIFSYYEKDHGFRDKRSLEEYVIYYLSKYKIKYLNLNFKILCFPRIFGYVFNPLSVIKSEKIMTASQYGKLVELRSLTLLKTLLKNPFLGFKVILSILFESIFIMFKGGKYYARNKKPIDSISFEGDF